jgi:hypothetical protein
MRTPVGFAFAPMQRGPGGQAGGVRGVAAGGARAHPGRHQGLAGGDAEILTHMPTLEKSRRDRIRELNKELASGTVGVEIGDVRKAFPDIPEIQAFLDEVAHDLIANVEVFLESAEAAANAPIPVTGAMASGNPRLRRYKVNVIVGDRQQRGRRRAGGDGAEPDLSADRRPHRAHRADGRAGHRLHPDPAGRAASRQRRLSHARRARNPVAAVRLGGAQARAEEPAVAIERRSPSRSAWSRPSRSSPTRSRSTSRSC